MNRKRDIKEKPQIREVKLGTAWKIFKFRKNIDRLAEQWQSQKRSLEEKAEEKEKKKEKENKCDF